MTWIATKSSFCKVQNCPTYFPPFLDTAIFFFWIIYFETLCTLRYLSIVLLYAHTTNWTRYCSVHPDLQRFTKHINIGYLFIEKLHCTRPCVPEFLPVGRRRGQGVMLTTHLHLAPRLRTSGAIIYSLYMPSCRGQGQLYHFTVALRRIAREALKRSECLTSLFSEDTVLCQAVSNQPSSPSALSRRGVGPFRPSCSLRNSWSQRDMSHDLFQRHLTICIKQRATARCKAEKINISFPFKQI